MSRPGPALHRRAAAGRRRSDRRGARQPPRAGGLCRRHAHQEHRRSGRARPGEPAQPGPCRVPGKTRRPDRPAEQKSHRGHAQADGRPGQPLHRLTDRDRAGPRPFQQINDHYGHAQGDDVLAAVGAAITASLRTSDFAGRFGGEEFLILLPDTAVEGAWQVAEKIRTTIAGISIPGIDRDITASLGIAGLLEHAGNATGLLREADRAQYAAKTAGRNRTIIATLGSTIDPNSTQPAGLPGPTDTTDT